MCMCTLYILVACASECYLKFIASSPVHKSMQELHIIRDIVPVYLHTNYIGILETSFALLLYDLAQKCEITLTIYSSCAIYCETQSCSRLL